MRVNTQLLAIILVFGVTFNFFVILYFVKEVDQIVDVPLIPPTEPLFESESSNYQYNNEEPISTDNIPFFCTDTTAELPDLMEMTKKDWSDHDITYTSHCKEDLLNRFKILKDHWEGPIVIVIFSASKHPFKELWKNIYCSDNYYERVTLSFVSPKDLNIAENSQEYPINKLRNYAWNLVKTDFTFVVDLDQIPNLNSYETIKFNVKEQFKNFDSSIGLIVPTFEAVNTQGTFVTEKNFVDNFPKDKPDLVERFNSKEFGVFYGTIWEAAYKPTDYGKWLNAASPYLVTYKPHFEPYVIVRTSIPVRFWEDFAGYGKNYASWTLELVIENFEFIVLPDSFIIHWSHPKSNQIVSVDNSKMRKSFLKHMFSKNLTEEQKELINRSI